MKHTFFLAGSAFIAATALSAAVAPATTLAPVAARQVKLGAVSALTYYTVEKDGFRVVTTVVPDDAAESGAPTTPVRFIVTLAAGQKTTISVPRNAGKPAIALRIARIGDMIELEQAAEIN